MKYSLMQKEFEDLLTLSEEDRAFFNKVKSIDAKFEKFKKKRKTK